MKRFVLRIALSAIALTSLCSCTDQLDADIAGLRNQVAGIEETVRELSSDISSLQTLISAIENNVLIESITKNSKGAYVIEFTNNTSISIKDGTNGVTPIVSVKYDEDLKGYYWTVNGSWMKDNNNRRVRATGIVPRLKIEDGYWYYSFDEKLTWNPLRIEASGGNGATIFSSIDCSDDYYVTFTLANNVVFQIPTTKGFDEMDSTCEQINSKLDAYREIINGNDSSIFVQSITEVVEGGESRGYDITLESGRVLEIRSGANDSTKVNLRISYDLGEGYFWQIWNGTDYEYILCDGRRLSSEPVSGQPIMGVRDSMGVLYFTVRYENEAPHIITDASGNAIRATGALSFHFFDKVESSGSVVTVTLAGGKKVSFSKAKEYMAALAVSGNAVLEIASGNASGDASVMASGNAFATVRDTVRMTVPYSSAAEYIAGGHSELTAVAVDAGYVSDIEPVAFTSNPVQSGVYAYEIKYRITFKADEAEIVPGHKMRVAVFLNFGDKVTMKVIEFAGN